MIHRLVDGDIIKLLPFVINEKLQFGLPMQLIYANYKLIYDNSYKNYINKLFHKLSISGKKLTTIRRYSFNCYINGEIKIVEFGKSIYDKIIAEKNYDIRSNRHLLVSMVPVENFVSYDGSTFIDKEWIHPVIDSSNGKEWFDWLVSNQPPYFEHIEKNNLFNKRNDLITTFGYDVLLEIISEEREMKLNKILN